MRRDPLDAVRCSALRSSAEILAGAAKSVSRSSHAKALRPGLAPPSGEVVTEFQSDSARTDSPVRILHAQPGSPVSGRRVWVRKMLPTLPRLSVRILRAQPRSRVSADCFGLPAALNRIVLKVKTNFEWNCRRFLLRVLRSRRPEFLWPKF